MTKHLNVKPISGAAAYLGGKRNLSKKLVAIIEEIPHKLYAEPFVGMGGVFFKRTTAAKNEAINDYSNDVSSFFKVIQKHHDEFIKHLKWYLNSRTLFENLAATPPHTLTDIERAIRFYYLQKTAFGGKVSARSFGIDPTRTGRFNVRKFKQHLEAIHERLENTMIECLPYAEFITRYDRKETLFYLDPPYYGNENDYGKNMFERADFERIAKQLEGIKGKFILSINDTPEIRDIFKAFDMEGVELNYSIARKAGTKAKELIIQSKK